MIVEIFEITFSFSPGISGNVVEAIAGCSRYLAVTICVVFTVDFVFVLVLAARIVGLRTGIAVSVVNLKTGIALGVDVRVRVIIVIFGAI